MGSTSIRSRRGTWVKSLGAFLCAQNRKEIEMKENKEINNKPDVIMCTDETGVQLYMSEKAANRLSWVLTGILALISLPVFILAFMSL